MTGKGEMRDKNQNIRRKGGEGREREVRGEKGEVRGRAMRQWTSFAHRNLGLDQIFSEKIIIK